VRLPRLRFTVRRLMFVVAVVGVVFGLYIASEQRAAEFRQRAIHHTNEFSGCYSPEGLTTAQIGIILQRREYHQAMMVKYRWAAHRPWLPVAPDPPEPKD
jgi:hypothetical protein